MLLIAIAWIYVVLMVAVVEATSAQGTLLGAAFTLLLYGVLPLSIVAYLFFSPARRRARRAADAARLPEGSESESFVHSLPLPLGEGGGEGPRSTAVRGTTPHPSPLPRGEREQAGSHLRPLTHSLDVVDPDQGGHAAGRAIAPKREEP